MTRATDAAHAAAAPSAPADPAADAGVATCLLCSESMHWSIVTRDGPDIVEGQCLRRRRWGAGCPERASIRD